MRLRKKIVLIPIIICVFTWLSVSAQEKPEWRFSILASVSDNTAAFYGGLENVKDKIIAQFNAVNSRYNDPDVFTGRFNFVVDSFKTFDGPPSLQYSDKLMGFDYQIVYDMFHSPRANWIGPPINSIAFHIPYSEGYPEIFSYRFVKIITHELGHARGGVDLYGMAISSIYNDVNSQGYEPEASIMSSTSDSIWCEHTINVINYNAHLVLNKNDISVAHFFDPHLGVRVVGSMGEVIENVKVNFFQHTWYDYAINSDFFASGTTNNDGVFLFKENPYIFEDIDYSYGAPFGLTRSLMLATINYEKQEYYFWLPFIDYQNKYFNEHSDTAFVTLELNTGIPNENPDTSNYLGLSQNYPNPFNLITMIQYSLAARSHVTLEVFNVLGQKIKSLVEREEAAGSHIITWDGNTAAGKPVASGVYLYRFQTGDYVETKKMILLK